MNIFWTTSASGDFATAANWSSNPAVPGEFDIAKMSVPGVTISDSSSATTVLGITTGADTTFLVQNSFMATEGTPTGANLGLIKIANGGNLGFGGIVDNIGTISLNAAGSATTLVPVTTFKDGIPDFTLEGGGNISMTDDANNEIGGFTNVDNKISGGGVISGEVHNQALGVIDATATVNGLVLAANVTNTGSLKATGGGILTIERDEVANSAGGVIEAGSSSTVEIFGAEIIGGTLKADSTGSIQIEPGDTTFDGSNAVVPTNKMITISGSVGVHPGVNLTLLGTINNAGVIDLAEFPEDLIVSAAGSSTQVVLEGKGSILLDNDSSPPTIHGEGVDAPVVTLVNVNNAIDGEGAIGGGNMALNNGASGIIDASGVDPLIIDTGANTVTNSGSFEADSGAELLIESTLNNTGALNSFDATILAAGKVTGTGHASINGTGQVEFGAASSNGTRFAAGSTGKLILDDSAQYTGTISGFGANTTQSIDLADFDITGARATSFVSGVLTLKNTAGQVVHLHISGTHTLASFDLSTDGNFNGSDDGTKITDPPAATKPQSPLNNLAGLFGQFIASWTSPTAALMSEAHSPLAAELQTGISLPHAQGFH